MALRSRIRNVAIDITPRRAEPTQRSLEREKMAGILETAVTVNHEVNSPLMAILCNVKLLLRDSAKLDKSLADKLRAIEASAERIQNVTRRLLSITTPRSVEYIEGIRMLDISDDNQREE